MSRRDTWWVEKIINNVSAFRRNAWCKF